jgi:hypothetical protein
MGMPHPSSYINYSVYDTLIYIKYDVLCDQYQARDGTDETTVQLRVSSSLAYARRGCLGPALGRYAVSEAIHAP